MPAQDRALLRVYNKSRGVAPQIAPRRGGQGGRVEREGSHRVFNGTDCGLAFVFSRRNKSVRSPHLGERSGFQFKVVQLLILQTSVDRKVVFFFSPPANCQLLKKRGTIHVHPDKAC